MKGMLIADTTLFDAPAGTLRPHTWVRTEGQHIVEVSDQPMAATDGVLRIDGRGRTLLPGLIDAHVHATITTMNLPALMQKPQSLIAYEARPILEGMLRRGFTTVRDAAGADWGLAEAVERGLIDGPRMFVSGRALSQTGGHGDFRPRHSDPPLCACNIYTGGFSHVADGVDAVRRAAREELRRGARQLKIMASGGVASPSDPVHNVQYSAEEMRAIVEEAVGFRTYAMAHAYSAEAVTRAVEAGVRTIEHGNLIDAATAKLMAARGAFLVPTLVTYFAVDELGARLGFPAENQRKLKDVLDAGLRSLELAKEAGVAMGFGTDLLGEAHDRQSREFRIRREVLPAAEILQSATVVNARILGMEGRLGVIAPGAYADLLLVDGDPLSDIGLLENPAKLVWIAKAGRIYRAEP